jgi:lipid-binding SYLF domain-containing protein
MLNRSFVAFAAAALIAGPAGAQPSADEQLAKATDLISAFTDAGGDSIPTELLERAQGIAVIPNVFRGGFILGARRGRGVLSLRSENGSWSNPAFITLTGGSIGWQIGAESTDIVLIFANDNAVRNIATGKFTLGGEASAVAGPLRREASSTMTFRAEVYGYLKSRGLYAGAAFQGARLNIDEDLGRDYYGDARTQPLGPVSASTPQSAKSFLAALDDSVLRDSSTIEFDDSAELSGTRTFPLPD